MNEGVKWVALRAWGVSQRLWWGGDLCLDVYVNVYAFVTQVCLRVCVSVTLCGFVLVTVYLGMFVFVYRSQCVSISLSLSSWPVWYVCMSLNVFFICLSMYLCISVSVSTSGCVSV